MQLNPDFPDDAIPDLLHLAYWGEVYIPLHEWAISGDSPICLPYQLPDNGDLLPYSNLDLPATAFLNGCGRWGEGGR